MNNFTRKCIAPLEVIKVIAKNEPLYLYYVLPQIILNAILPILYIYFPRLVIEQLMSGNPYSEVVRVIVIYICILLFVNAANLLLKYKSDIHSELFASKLKNEIGKISMDLEVKDIENTETRDMIRMAKNATELTATMSLVQNIVSNIITIAALAYIIVQLDWLFIVLVAISLIVRVVFVRIQFNFRKTLRKLEAENGRYVEYLNRLSYRSEGGAKEIRLNSLQKWYMDKVKIYRNEMLGLNFKSFRMTTRHNIISAIILALQSFIILWMLSLSYMDGAISIAQFTMYFSAVAALTGSLSSITELLGSYGQQVLNVSDYKKFKGEGTPALMSDFAKPDKIEIVFSNVSFSYPNNDKQVLRNINIKITDSEKLSIVGMNGAGKSTFIKLLCKFYKPSSGVITLNGVDIWEISNESYYKIIAAVFQDFENLSFTIKESVSMSEAGDTEKIDKIILGLGLDERIGKLPDGYDTYLSRNFNRDGTEFSGGQAQKLAIARALYKDAPLLILDEPTANLDPKAEGEIYTEFFKMAKDKTTIFISHRMAASTLADTIAVFAGGEIVEYGPHEALMQMEGVYAGMYHKQSKQYVSDILADKTFTN